MIHGGREFTFNARTGEGRYLDTPDATYSLPVQHVENRAAPQFEPTSHEICPAPSKRRQNRHEP
jgi:hypothetical protein